MLADLAKMVNLAKVAILAKFRQKWLSQSYLNTIYNAERNIFFLPFSRQSKAL